MTYGVCSNCNAPVRKAFDIDDSKGEPINLSIKTSWPHDCRIFRTFGEAIVSKRAGMQ